MPSDRRFFLKGLGAALILSVADIRSIVANELNPGFTALSPINVIIPKSYQPPSQNSSNNYRHKLTRAVLELLQDKYSSQKMPVWEQPFGQVDMEKRVFNITYWLLLAVQRYKKIYPVDPAWVMAQIMKESYFYEFAVSSSLAVGICQFIQPTAQEHNMLCAGMRDEHHRFPYKKLGFSAKAEEYYQLRRELRRYRRNNRPKKRYDLEEALGIIHSGKAKRHRKAAGQYLTYLDKVESFHKKRREAVANFKTYLEANVAGKNLFDKTDLNFILNFDERFTYKKPVSGMVNMLGKGLRARNGNILAATIGYNAGLASTIEKDEIYKDYGKIPAIEQSTRYLSHVIINHYEIVRRMA